MVWWTLEVLLILVKKAADDWKGFAERTKSKISQTDTKVVLAPHSPPPLYIICFRYITHRLSAYDTEVFQVLVSCAHSANTM
jgi:hypothetical protein